MRKATSNTSIGGLGDNTQYYSIVAQLSITKLLAKTALATDVKISDSGVHWIGCDPNDCRRLGYHLTNGWSGVLDLMKPCVTHAHCPPAPWLEARQSEVRAENSLEPDALSVPLSDLRRRTPCWLPDGGSFAVGLGVKPGVRVLDFAPTPKSRHWIHGLTIADLEREPDGRYATGNEPVFIETSSKIFSVAAHPYHHGELIAGGESALCLLGYGHVAVSEQAQRTLAPCDQLTVMIWMCRHGKDLRGSLDKDRFVASGVSSVRLTFEIRDSQPVNPVS